MSTPAIQYSLKTRLIVEHQDYNLDTALSVLNQIHQQGNLRAAAQTCGYSYRKTWDMVKQFEKILGAPLVYKQRGRGTGLSKLGLKLIQLDQHNKSLFSDELTTAADDTTAELQRLIRQPQSLKIAASDSEKLQQLKSQNPDIELHIAGSTQALTLYAEGKCDIAGFHIAAKSIVEQLQNYNRYLDPKNDRFILLEQRQQGLISHPEHPVESFQDIVENHLVFVNRQNGSGTRLLLDKLLKQQKIIPEQINGYYHEEHTHLAVATMIASRQVDVGLGTKKVATNLQMHFAPISKEFYFLVFNASARESPRLLNRLVKWQLPTSMEYKALRKLITQTLL